MRRRGYFDWRTWSVKANLRRGTYHVEVLHQDGTPVSCDLHGEAVRPCVFGIRVGAAAP